MLSFPYPGGKIKMLDWLLSYFPEEGRRYVEPFAGRGNVFFNFKPRALYESWHLNDIKTGRFFTALKRVPVIDLPVFEDVMARFDHYRTRAELNDPIALAIEPWVSFRGKGYRYGRQSSQRYSIPKAEAKILAAQNLLLDSSVHISNQDWIWLPWDSYDERDFIYLDPPYLGEGRHTAGYDDINHEELCGKLLESKARWLLSGYDNEIYRSYLGPPDYQVERTLEMSNKNSAVSVECIWSDV